MTGGLVKNIIKIIICIINIPIVIFGAVAVGLGIWIALDNPSFLALTQLDGLAVVDQSFVKSGAYVIIAGGAAIFVFGIIGIVGTLRENACLLGMYVATLTTVIALEVAAIVLGIVYQSIWKEKLDTIIQKNIREEYDGLKNTKDWFTMNFDLVQRELGCCGHNNSDDFKLATKWNETASDGSRYTVPAACCKSNNYTVQGGVSEVEQCMKSPTPDNANLKGCKTALEELFNKYEHVIIGVASAAVACQFLMLILALILLCWKSKSDDVYTFKE